MGYVPKRGVPCVQHEYLLCSVEEACHFESSSSVLNSNQSGWRRVLDQALTIRPKAIANS